jgi:hypothetical protein
MSFLPLGKDQKRINGGAKLFMLAGRPVRHVAFCFFITINGGVEASQVIPSLDVAKTDDLMIANKIGYERSPFLTQKGLSELVGGDVVLTPSLKPEGVPVLNVSACVTERQPCDKRDAVSKEWTAKDVFHFTLYAVSCIVVGVLGAWAAVQILAIRLYGSARYWAVFRFCLWENFCWIPGMERLLRWWGEKAVKTYGGRIP